MNTFLPYSSFSQSAKALDNKRLGKQRVECWQMLRALRSETKGWRKHPAVRMWEGAEGALCDYAIAVCTEWRSRGFRDTMLSRFEALISQYSGWRPFALSWLTDEAFHASHRSNLLRKNPEHYGKFGWTESPDLPYVWPTNQG